MKEEQKIERGSRRRLPPERRSAGAPERRSATKTIRLVDEDGRPVTVYATVGLYEDGSPGELFLVASTKQGSTLSGLLDAWATAVSFALQYGAPLESMVEKFAHAHYGPASPPGPNAASSVTDAVARWLRRFVPVPAENPASGDRG